MDQQKNMLQTILKHFVAQLTNRPVTMSVVDAKGVLVEHACRLDQDLTCLEMRPIIKQADADAGGGGSACTTLAFAEIVKICSPEEVRNLNFDIPFRIDELCTTVVTADNHCLTFKVETVAAREFLMLCLHVLRMSKGRPKMWYP